MNIDLLKQLYCLHAPSMKEQKIRRFIAAWIAANVPGAKVVSTNGNMFITRGEADNYPCIAAHLDQVQHNHSKDFQVIEAGGVLFGYSPANKRQEGLGADDKNGVFIALSLLAQYDVIKVALFRGEEIGCVGSSECDLAFFDDVRYIVECDRRGSSDMITYIQSYICSPEFVDAVTPLAANYGYAENNGMLTDVCELVSRGVGVSCINLSCGYYHPHTDSECTVISELENCYNFVCSIVENLKDVYYYTPILSAPGGFNWSDYFGLSDTAKEGAKNNGDVDLFELDNMLYNLIWENPGATFEEIWACYADMLGSDKEFTRERFNAVAREVDNYLNY